MHARGAEFEVGRLRTYPEDRQALWRFFRRGLSRRPDHPASIVLNKALKMVLKTWGNEFLHRWLMGGVTTILHCHFGVILAILAN